MHEIAHALESSPPKQRTLLFSLLKTEEEGDVLFELGEEIQQDLVSNISNEELTEAVKELEFVNKVGESEGYSKLAYDIKGATINEILYPSLDPSIFEIKYPDTDIQGRVVTN